MEPKYATTWMTLLYIPANLREKSNVEVTARNKPNYSMVIRKLYEIK